MNVTDAAYDTVHQHPGGSEALAPRLGISAAVLRGKVNPNSDRNLLSLQEADALMARTGTFESSTPCVRSMASWPSEPMRPCPDH